MSATTDNLSLLFSSTERRKGEAFADDRAVQISSSSDTQVSAFVRSSSPARVTLMASEVAGSAILAKCTCTAAKKDNLCRHIWATLLKLEALDHDFLLGKDSISLASDDATVYRYGSEVHEQKRSDHDSDEETAGGARSRKQTEFKERQKALAKEYRKQQSQKLKEIKKQPESRSRKTREPAFTYPSHVEEARRYFQANGFEMKQPFSLSEVVDAKKQLSRVFHPDKGGSHAEILELNHNFQILSDYLKS